MIPFTGLEPAKQQEVYRQVLKLKKEGLGYKKIRRKFRDELGVNLSLGTLSYWFNNDVKNVGGENYFEVKPSPELAYVLGVMFGDGSFYCDKKLGEYVLQIYVTDKDFAENFSKCCSILLRKKKPIAVNYIKPIRKWKAIYSARIRSKQLYHFVKSIKEDFEKGKGYIEKYPVDFIRGLADSEGCPVICAARVFKISVIVASSTNFELLKYTQGLLSNFNIKSTLRLSRKSGVIDPIIEGRKILRAKDLYDLSLNSNSAVKLYFDKISFSISRKHVKLFDGINLLGSSSKDAIRWWTSNYVRTKKMWVKINGWE